MSYNEKRWLEASYRLLGSVLGFVENAHAISRGVHRREQFEALLMRLRTVMTDLETLMGNHDEKG